MLKIIFLMLFFKPRMKGKKLFIEKKTEKKKMKKKENPIQSTNKSNTQEVVRICIFFWFQ